MVYEAAEAVVHRGAGKGGGARKRSQEQKYQVHKESKLRWRRIVLWIVRKVHPAP